MKSTGIVRKIDELGRVVIPKEIRNILGIENGDDLEFYVENEAIVLTKYSKLYSNKNVNNKMLNSLSDLTDANIYISDKNEVVTTGDLEGAILPEKLKKLLNDRKDYVSTFEENIKFGVTQKTGYFLVKPIIEDSSLNGLLIIYKKTPLLKEDHFFADILKNIIENK